MTDIIIIGAAGCGREVANWIEDINKVEPTWNILGFLDDNPNALDVVARHIMCSMKNQITWS